MKSYIQGLVTGGVLIFAFMVLTGQKHGHKDNHGPHDIDDIMHKLEDLEGRIKNIEGQNLTVDWEVPLWTRKEYSPPIIITQLDASPMRIIGTTVL